MAESSFGSNNPFRRKTAAGSSSSLGYGSATPPPPSGAAADRAGATVSPSVLDSPLSMPTAEQFRNQLQSLAHSAQPPPTTSFQKPKVVKKVRVQSPPPSSPESVEAPEPQSRWLPGPYDSGDLDNEGRNPFGNTTSLAFAGREDEDNEDDEDDGDKAEPQLRGPTPRRLFGDLPPILSRDTEMGVPESPWDRISFPRSDEEVRGKDLDGAPSSLQGGGGRSLDVSAFHRLLVTGSRDDQGSSPTSPAFHPASAQSYPSVAVSAREGGSTIGPSSVSGQPIFGASYIRGATSRPLDESSDEEDEYHELISSNRQPKNPKSSPGILRKKPPPPSSRHGKFINETKAEEGSKGRRGTRNSSPASLTLRARPSTPSDANKPLPPAPIRDPADEERENIFDREAAGKVPELDIDPDSPLIPPPRPPTPPNTSHATSTLAPTPAPATGHVPHKPAPPPRRQPHGRMDSKLSLQAGFAPTVLPSSPHAEEGGDPTPTTRSSFESNRSRSSSLRFSTNAPAPPPPPRRPNHATRVSGSYGSPGFPGDGGEPRSPEVERSLSFSQISQGSAEALHPTAAVAAAPLPSPDPSLTVGGVSSSASSNGSGSLTRSAGQLSKAVPPPPPPPPARYSSMRTRRPVTPSSAEDVAPRKSSREKEGSPSVPPPPPPPRQRGSSRGSMDGAGAVIPRRASAGSVKTLRSTGVGAAAAQTDGPGTAAARADSSASRDILADLAALQREVDEARSKAGSGSGSGS